MTLQSSSQTCKNCLYNINFTSTFSSSFSVVPSEKSIGMSAWASQLLVSSLIPTPRSLGWAGSFLKIQMVKILSSNRCHFQLFLLNCLCIWVVNQPGVSPSVSFQWHMQMPPLLERHKLVFRWWRHLWQPQLPTFASKISDSKSSKQPNKKLSTMKIEPMDQLAPTNKLISSIFIGNL